jgi:PAS domain-containing protein
MTNRHKNGSVYVEEQTITPVLDAGGNPAYFIAVKQDRTLRRRADDALRRSEERYRLLAENISDVIGLYESVGNSSTLRRRSPRPWAPPRD